MTDLTPFAFRVRTGRWLMAIAVCLLLGIPGSYAQNPAPPELVTTNHADARACQAKLNKIFEGIREYEQKVKRLPDWLSDLHPEFIDDPSVFICPFVERMGDYQSWRSGVRVEVFWDPILPISYGYEFCVADYELWANHKSTVQRYKKGQMQVVGPAVPLVRCLAHRPFLNLSYGGRYFESPSLEWEKKFKGTPQYETLFPKAVFAIPEFLPVAGKPVGRIPPREPGLSPKLVDLSDFFHVALDVPWGWRNPSGENLATLPRGVQRLERTGVTFDIRGLVQLDGEWLHAPYPQKVEGIRIEQKCQTVHFLVGTYFQTREQRAKAIGQFDMTYGDGPGGRETRTIIYGKDVLKWRFDPAHLEVGHAQAVWTGRNQAGKKHNRHIRLFHMQWNNPHPDRVVKTIDFSSHRTTSAPFLLAITLD